MASTLKQHTSKSPALTTSKIEEIQIEPFKPSGLSDLLDQLGLLVEAEDYDDDCQPPTESSVVRMRGFLENANNLLKIAIPQGTICTDGDGGLRLEWIRPDRELRLVVSASPQGRSYLYHEQGDDYGADYGADYAPSDSELSRWLTWLAS